MRQALFIAAALASSACAAELPSIRVDAGKTIAQVSRYMTGACLEDVNHEVYGGLYSQMLFGESFQEPALAAPIRGFSTYGGRWVAEAGIVSVDVGPGPKLVSDHAPMAAGEAGAEVFLPGKSGGVAGLVLMVREPGVGADRFIGYEVALSTEPPLLVLGRHRHNWEHIKNVPCAVPADRWVSLVVRMRDNTMEVLVDAKSIVTYEDKEHPLAAGRVGLRSFQRACRFRNLWVKPGDTVEPIPLEAVRSWEDGVSGMWRGYRNGTAAGRFAVETREPFVGRQSQRLTFESGNGAVGIENRGLNRQGLYLVEGKPYEGYLWARAEQPAELVVALQDGDGQRVHATRRLPVAPGGWRRLDFTLTPNATVRGGRFALELDRPGSVAVGHAFMQPGEWGRFKGLPVRKDVAEALVAQGLTVLRYGGSMVNAPDYRWKQMIGPRDRRPPYTSFWYHYASNGWGIVDFLDFCASAGFLAVPAFNMGETPQDLADFIEYANGPADSPWGGKRKAAGRPAPYGLKYIELGNEEAVDEDYWKLFKPLAEAVWAKDPTVTVVVGDFAFNARIADPFHFEGAPRIKSLAAHRKILELARAHGRPVWFDVHVWNDAPRDCDAPGGGIIGLRDFGAALARLCPGADFKVCVFEENAGNHSLRRGLAHAHAINELERSGDLVRIVCAANCLQPHRQNDNGWDQGLLFLTPEKVWGQPSFYVTQMVARHYLPRCVQAEVTCPHGDLDVTAKTDDAGKVLQLQVVNLDQRPVRTTISIDGFRPTRPEARVVEIKGELKDVNSAEEPERVAPRTRSWQHALRDGRAEYTFPPYSFTIIVLE